MTRIGIYDADAQYIEDLSNDYDTSTAEVISAILNTLQDEGIDITEYL